MNDARQIFDWLVDGAPGANGPVEVIGRLCEGLLAAGIRLERVAALVRTLHPHIAGRAFYWQVGQAVVAKELPYAAVGHGPGFEASPIGVLRVTKTAVRRRIMDPDCVRDFAILADLAAQGITDYLAVPLNFLSGETHAITFATKHPAGFPKEHIEILTKVCRPLSRVAEILALKRTAVNLLNTYVGHSAGERILAGKIRRGDTDSIRAVIWFSDLRGFTELAGSTEAPALVAILNEVFECQVPAIDRHGGEVLKFIGDGLLAIFPVESASRAPDICNQALAAANEAFAELRRLNEARLGRGAASVRFGLALHVGDVAYGNIGSAGRLDFTCIGPAVNVASRLEALTSKLSRPVVVSAELAALTTTPMTSVGRFELKGVAAPQDVFVPRDADHPLSKY